MNAQKSLGSPTQWPRASGFHIEAAPPSEIQVCGPEFTSGRLTLWGEVR